MVSGNGKYVGGNQSDGVTETSFNRSGLRAIIRPPTADEVGQPNKPKPQEPSSAPVPLNPKLSNFGKCLPLLLKHEGGNDDDPRDPGGRTSRGILQREWNVWRASHPGLPSDVWEAPQDEIDAIYKQKYWDVLRCDEPPSGVDYAVFDYGVNSGNSRAAKVLQRLVGVDADGEIGPLTIGATLRVDPKTLVGQICDERLAFLKGLHTWPTFGGGWSRRVSEVRAAAEAMTTLPKPSTTPDQPGHEDHTQSNKNLTQVANISTGVGPMSDTHTSIPQLNLLNLPQLQAIKQQIDSLIKQGGAVPLHLPANVNLAQLADINKQLEAFVQLASTILPILSMFVPQLKVLIPILPVLTGLLNMGDDIAQAGNDPGKIADALAAHLKDVAQQVQASKLPGQG
jgi:lysozyme family protein